MADVVPFEERYLGSVLDFSVRAAPGFFFSWAGKEELLRWKHMRQPTKLPGEVVPLWLAVENGRIIGARGSMIGRYWLAGTEVLGAIGCDYYIEPEHRGTSIGKELLRQSIELAPLRLNLNSSKASHVRHLSMGFREISGTDTHLHIHNVAAALGWLLRRRLRGRGGRGTPDSIERVREWVAAEPDVRVLTEEHREETEVFLGQVQRRYTLAGLRNVDELLWRYREHPQRHGEVFLWFRSGQLAAVIALANQNRAGLRILVLADLYLREPDASLLAKAWRLTRRAATATGAHATSVFGSDEQLNRVVHRSPLTYVRHHMCSMQLEGGPKDIRIPSCYLSAGDGDYIS